MTAWPISPPPQHDESLISWFTRVGRQYALAPCELLDAVERTRARRKLRTIEATLWRLRSHRITDTVADLAQLPTPPRKRLWRRPTQWELRAHPLALVCPQCWVHDIDGDTEPYGRQSWQQAWYTVCDLHRLPLVRSKLVQEALLRATAGSNYRLAGLRAALCRLQESSTCRTRYARQVAAALLEIQRAAQDSLLGVVPDPIIWGPLQPAQFLQVLADLTTWSLTHFEPVLAWSAAEELTDLERQHAGNALLGRQHRCLPGAYPKGPSTRDMKELVDPAVRRSALWLAHALMASRHADAADGVGGGRPQLRQRNRLSAAAPAGLQWLADRSQGWPAAYRGARWINLKVLAELSR